jgi:cytochrome c-type biogenesis protein
VLGPAVIFCLSFTLMFVALGMTATGLGSTLRDSKATLDKVAGILIVAMGVFFLLTPLVPRLNREWRPDALIRRAGAGGPIIAGLAFAIAWTPCVGPTLASILAAASTSDTVAHGGVLLAFYSLGLAVPFLLTAVAFDRATSAFGWIRHHYMLVTAVSGCVLIVMGTLILTGELTQLNVQAQKGLSNLGLDFLYKI